MAIAPTGAIYKSLIFDGQDSRDYGVYITGEAVYNAPERDVEIISIPGRNGAFALDKGRFENIEVMYPAGIFADNETDFAKAISDFRNFLCSRKGYCRLEDEYNPDEYRMAVYKSGLEVSPTQLKSGEFEIIFECKPQRWLTEGEEAVSVESGDTITNPTLFEAGPLLMVEGEGNINFNGSTISIVDSPLGNIIVAGSTIGTTITIDTSLLEIGDEIYCDPSASNFIELQLIETAAEGYKFLRDGVYITSRTINTSPIDAKRDWVFNYGTSKTYPSRTCSPSIGEMVYTTSGTYVGLTSCAIYARISYDGDKTFTLTYSISKSESLNPETYDVSAPDFRSSPIYANSTRSTLGNPTYIDCDIGEAYMINDEQIVSLNGHIDLGSDLPTLAEGENEITFDNTITDLQIVPRWWKV